METPRFRENIPENAGEEETPGDGVEIRSTFSPDTFQGRSVLASRESAKFYNREHIFVEKIEHRNSIYTSTLRSKFIIIIHSPENVSSRRRFTLV